MKWFKRRFQQQIIKGKRLFLVFLFLTLIIVIGQLIIKFNWKQKQNVVNNQGQPLAVLIFLSYAELNFFPNISPVDQLDSYTSSMSAERYNLFPNGELVPGSDDSKINLLFTEKPTQQKLEQIFILTTSIVRALPVTKGYLLEDNFYFASSNLPNIIIPLSIKAEELPITLQAIPSMAKIKEGIKIIDLRFNNPIIK